MDQLLINIQNEYFFSLAIVLGLGLIKWLLNRFIHNRIEDVATRYKWRKLTTYFISIIGLFFILIIWVKQLQSLATFFGLFTAGIAIALRDLISSIVGWIFILWKRPFSIGDRIEIAGTVGDVIDIRFFQFSLIEVGNWVDADQSTGRVVHVPNNKVLSNRILNYSAGFSFIWNEIPVLITFESNWEKAKKILLEIVNRHSEHLSETARSKVNKASQKFMIYYGKLTPIIYTRVKESGILLTIRYLCEPQKRRTSEGLIWEEVLKEFAGSEDIDFAYPTQRFYFKEDDRDKGKKINQELESE